MIDRPNRTVLWLVIFLTVVVATWLSYRGVLPPVLWELVWPIPLMVIGVALVFRKVVSWTLGGKATHDSSPPGPLSTSSLSTSPSRPRVWTMGLFLIGIGVASLVRDIDCGAFPALILYGIALGLFFYQLLPN